MSGLLDTSMLVRYLTGDPPELAERASRVIDQVEDLQVSDIVLAETVYVLTSVYKIPREAVIDHLILFLQKENVRPFALRKDNLLQALLLCRPSRRISFADVLVWAAARSTEEEIVYSLDGRFPRDGVEVRMGRDPVT
jgi:predicted nucleic acid-binding protein